MEPLTKLRRGPAFVAKGCPAEASSRLRLFEVIPRHVMCFCMRNASCAVIWLRLCMLPTPTADDAGDASSLGPSRAQTHKVHARARARQRPQNEHPKKSSPQASPETQTQQNSVNSGVLWLGSRASAPAGPKTNGEKTMTAQRTNQLQKQNGQNNSPTLSIAVFDGICGVL